MIVLLLILMSGSALAQDEAVKRGAALFRTTCAVAYCHGQDGSAGRVPKLTGHTLAINRVFATIANGNAEKGMPGFSSSLKTEDIDALVKYVMSMAGAGPPRGLFGESGERKTLPTELEAGRRLFFDAARMNGCGACHEINGWGNAIGPDLAKSTGGLLDRLSEVGVSRVMTMTPAKEAAFPGLVVDKGPPLKIYDLSSPLPVLRTFGGAVALTQGSGWNHRQAIAGYSDQELISIGRFLRSMGAK